MTRGDLQRVAIDQDLIDAEESVSGPPSKRAERLRHMLAQVSKRTPTQRDADKHLFRSRLTEPDLVADFDRHGWTSALNAEAIFEFWDEMELD